MSLLRLHHIRLLAIDRRIMVRLGGLVGVLLAGDVEENELAGVGKGLAALENGEQTDGE